MQNSINFQDKVALITGGSTGIGYASAEAFGRAGAKVVIAGRSASAGAKALAALRGQNIEALFVRTDVSRDKEVAALVAQTIAAFGRLDCAFNNAGVEGQAALPLAEQSEESYEQVFDINVRGVFLSMRHQIPVMLANGGGAIVNNASIAGLVGFAGSSIYTASKHAVIGFTKAAALEYSKAGVRVNAVAPAAIETPMLERFTQKVPVEMLRSFHPIGRLGKAQEIASAVLWLCSPGAGFVSGHTLTVDGAFTAQ